MLVGSLLAMGLLHFAQMVGLMGDREAARSADYYQEVLELVQERYVEPDQVKSSELTREALKGMLRSLDPYSDFMRAPDYESLQEDIGSKFGGIGVQIEFRDGFVVVIAPMAGTPGEAAGILRGDRVLAVDGESMEGFSINNVVSRLRGEPGESVEISLDRAGEDDPVDVTVVREIIKVDSVTNVNLVAPTIGYLRIAQFSEPTARELKAAVADLRDQGMTSLVIDVRNNPGGLLSAAQEVLDPFFAAGEMMVYTEGRRSGDRREYRSLNEGEVWDFPVVVLINKGSASASEILAGALKDSGKAWIVGETSFGKGSVQSVIALRNGEGLRLTTGRYYTPSGVTVNEVGVIPDHEIIMTPEDDLNVALQRNRPDIVDPLAFAERFGFAPIEDVQLKAAVAHLQGDEEPTEE
jgi:carboxyl-terminal processing protease